MKKEIQIDVQDIDHLGIIAGIIDEIGIVEIIDKELGTHSQEKVSAGEMGLCRHKKKIGHDVKLCNKRSKNE